MTNNTTDLENHLLDHWTAWGSPREREQTTNETTMALDCKLAADQLKKFREALEKIHAMDWEQDEWDGAAKYHEVRAIVLEALT